MEKKRAKQKKLCQQKKIWTSKGEKHVMIKRRSILPDEVS